MLLALVLVVLNRIKKSTATSGLLHRIPEFVPFHQIVQHPARLFLQLCIIRETCFMAAMIQTDPVQCVDNIFCIFLDSMDHIPEQLRTHWSELAGCLGSSSWPK